MSINWTLIVAGAVLVLLEVILGAVSGFDFLLIGSAMMLGGILGLATKSVAVGVTTAGVLALVYVFVGRKRIRMRLRRSGISSNADALLGRTVRVSQTIAVDRAGRIRCEGEEWRAEIDRPGGGPIEAGRDVRINRIDGVTVYVQPVEKYNRRCRLVSTDMAIVAASGGLGIGLLGFFAFILLIILARSARIVAQYEKGLVMRLGKYHATADSGLNFLTPLVDEIIKVDMREQVIQVEPQKVITRDNVTVTVDAVIYYRVADPVRAMFEVQNFGLAATTLAQTNLRNLIGDKSLDETLIARDMINTNLRAVLDEATNGWGVKVTRVEVQKIDPPSDITEAMSRQMKAERDKRASILESEGVRQSEILKAEGFKQAEILKAEGDAQARLTRATAEAKAIEMVSNAAEQFFHDRAALSRQLEVLQATLTNNTKFILPGNADLVAVLGLESNTSPALVPLRREGGPKELPRPGGGGGGTMRP